MNDIVSKMISTQALLFVYMLCGVVISKLRIIRDDNREVLVRLLMDVCMPMMVLDAVNKPTSMEQLRSSMLVLIIAGSACLVTWVIALLLWRKSPENQRSVLNYASLFSNAGNAGLPVINLVFGSTGVFYGSMYLIPPRLLQWTVGVGFFMKQKNQSWVKQVLLNPMVVVMYIGFFMMGIGCQITGVLGDAIKNIGSMTGPLSMILIGATLANMDLRMLFEPSVLKITACRLLIFPLMFACVLRYLPVDHTTATICVVLLAMPIASNTASIAERYGGDHVFASACISVSTLLSVVTVPFVTWVVQYLLG